MAPKIQVMRIGVEVIITFCQSSAAEAEDLALALDKQIRDGLVVLRCGKPVETKSERKLVSPASRRYS